MWGGPLPDTEAPHFREKFWLEEKVATAPAARGRHMITCRMICDCSFVRVGSHGSLPIEPPPAPLTICRSRMAVPSHVLLMEMSVPANVKKSESIDVKTNLQ